ncbi:unnamed protein product [Phyllotreta striolata]|uniref:Uncharacterized protein n=1 Tax=Phyllotreta striolata TaxID=444603 RepID=A0A9N9TXY6_PHYSR|nr:unnamed protein product [Phyllotreta striolata]
MKLVLLSLMLVLCICTCSAILACPPKNPPCDPYKCAIPGCSTGSVLKKRHPCDCCESCYSPRNEGEDCSPSNAACVGDLLCVQNKCARVLY